MHQRGTIIATRSAKTIPCDGGVFGSPGGTRKNPPPPPDGFPPLYCKYRMVVPTPQVDPAKAHLLVRVEVRMAVGVRGHVVPTPAGAGPSMTIAAFGQGMDSCEEMV